MSRPEVLGLLRDIKQRPEEPGLRLILADWLEDHGDAADCARAELIRSQVRGGGDGRALIAAHRKAWLGPIAPWCPSPRFREGLMSVTLSAGDLAASPLRALAEGENWAWVDEVVLQPGNLPRRLSDNPLLTTLNSFRCTDTPSRPDLIEDLARAHWLRSVRRLDLSGMDLTGVHGGVEPLVRSPYLTHLQELTSSRSFCHERWIGSFARLRLRRLTLSHGRLGDRESAALAREPDCASLEELNLADNEIGDAGARALAESPWLVRLQLLTLFGNRIGAEGVRRLRERFGARVLIAGG